MKLKLDENLSRHLKPLLTRVGHDVLTAADENLLSCSDTEIAAAALREERMLLTLDVEFADLRKYPPGSHPGIILFRPPSLVRSFVSQQIYCRFCELRRFEQTHLLCRHCRSCERQD